MTLEEAQWAKVDLSLGKLGLQPGMTCSTSAAVELRRSSEPWKSTT